MMADDIMKLHPGTAAKHDGTLQGMMGDVWDAEKQRKAVRERRMTFRGQGKDHAEIEAMLKAEFVKAHEGRVLRFVCFCCFSVAVVVIVVAPLC